MRTIRIAGGVGAIALLLALSACGGAGGSANTASTSTPPNIPPDTTLPTVSINTPTASGSYSTASTPVALAGSASDNVGVTSVTWSNAGNNTTGNASGTNPWNTSIALALGMNTITVTAHDAAGNIRNATLTVTYNPGGGTSLSGSVDSSLINRSGPNAVYVYSGTVTPGEIGSGTPPLTTAPVSQDNNACTFGYQVAGLAAGTYTVAFANQTDNPGVNDAIVFKGTAQVMVAPGGGAIHNFLPTRLLQVGSTKTFARPSAAAAAAQDGDVIEIDVGEYLDDIVVWRQNNLTLRGVGGGRAYMHATQIIPFDPSLGDRVVAHFES